jgi:hypothetical protein
MGLDVFQVSNQQEFANHENQLHYREGNQQEKQQEY